MSVPAETGDTLQSGDIPNLAPTTAPTVAPTLGEATRVWAHIGLLSFGGPAGQIALMHREIVEERRWVDEDRFLHALNFCMLLPGPEAQQLATYVGWLLHGWRGGVIAGGLFVLPGLALMLVLSAVYAQFHSADWLLAAFVGLKAAVLVIVAEAVWRLSRRALKTQMAVWLAILAFLALFVFGLPFPLVVLSAALVGLLTARGGGTVSSSTDAGGAGLWRSAGVALGWLLIWAAPLALIVPLSGFGSVFFDLFVFFSKMAVVTFGGAYAVLAYVAQEAVQNYGWLVPGEMLDGLALAETTPGPLVLVLSFVGFLAGVHAAGPLPPLLAGTLGGLLTAWVTFVPSFLWILVGAPHVERLRGNRWLSGALQAVTAAAVGVIVNLAVWFALHTLFAEIATLSLGPAQLPVPAPASIQPAVIVLVGVAAVLLWWWRLGVPRTLAIMAALGLALHYGAGMV